MLLWEGLEIGIGFLDVGTLEFGKSSDYKEITLDESQLFVSLVADVDVIEVGDTLEVSWGLAKVHGNSGVAERRLEVTILAHQDLDVSYN